MKGLGDIFENATLNEKVMPVKPKRFKAHPTDITAMVFNCADPYWAFQIHTEAGPVPMCFASGQFTSNYHLLMKGKIGIVGIVFKAPAMY